MARGLEGLQRLERLWAAETKSLHDLLQDRRDGVLQEGVEDELPDVPREVCSGARHVVPRAGMKQEGRLTFRRPLASRAGRVDAGPLRPRRIPIGMRDIRGPMDAQRTPVY